MSVEPIGAKGDESIVVSVTVVTKHHDVAAKAVKELGAAVALLIDEGINATLSATLTDDEAESDGTI